MIQVHSIGPYRGFEMYWGVEYDIPVTDVKHVSHAWLIEDLPPFRRSTWGCRIRFGSRALHLGRCERGEDPHRRGIATVDEIRNWDGGHGAESDRPEGSGSSAAAPEQVRLDEGGRPVLGSGGGLVELDPLGDELPSLR